MILAAALIVGAGLERGTQPTGLASVVQGGTVRLVIAQRMPQLDGKNLTSTLVEVSYPPGGASQAHSHPCAVIAYVLEGEIESQVQGQPAAIYKAGQTFYEPPHGVHAISRNASQTKPARLLAYFLCDQPGPLTVPPPNANKENK
jgi:quercetin dioxygenase-like cupin family protein